MKKISYDVRQFAQPCPRSGSIEAHSGYGPPPLSSLQLHASIQKRRQRELDNYRCEFPLAYGLQSGPYEFWISGRADGINLVSHSIEEIKTSFDLKDLYRKLLIQPDHPYILQLKTYGYFYYKNYGVIPQLNLHLVSSRNFKSMDLPIILDIAHYELWLSLRLREVLAETQYKEVNFKRRQREAANLPFPFKEPRKGQLELIKTIEENNLAGGQLLLQAPTGLGKTMGVLYPTLKESLSRGQKTVYVTPKNSQHKMAEEAVEKLREQGAQLKSLTLTAKSKMCLKAETLCNPGYCEYARNYYSKLESHSLIDRIQKLDDLKNEDFIEIGQKFEVCPFELSIEAISHADVIIGDYNYAFSPRSLVTRLAESYLEPQEKANLVIDEAHNLHSRAQDYFSPSLSVSDLESIEKDFTQLEPYYALQGSSLIRKAKSLITDFGLSGSSRKISVNFEIFAELDKDISTLTQEYLESDSEIIQRDPVIRLSNTWNEFLNALEYSGPEFFTTYQTSRFNELIKITCCDASHHLRQSYDLFKNVIAFSATLKPFDYYQELLGFDKKSSTALEIQSPFPAENRKLLVIPQIRTKFSERTASAPKIAEVIKRVTALKAGNYIALFPSFEFLQLTLPLLKCDGFNIISQRRDTKADEIEAILNSLKDSEVPQILLCVQGGVFSEGVDFHGDMLIGAFVIGPALPSFDFEKEQVREYFKNRFAEANAFDYTYVYPAMARAIQSAGRVIRSEKERGLIVLMDNRFLQRSYSDCMPQDWFNQSPQELVSTKILGDIEEFWKRG